MTHVREKKAITIDNAQIDPTLAARVAWWIPFRDTGEGIQGSNLQ